MTDWTWQQASSHELRRRTVEIGRRRDEALDEGYWLRHCHGFRVDSAGGRVGIVEDVLYGADLDQPSALAVRGGLFGRRLEVVEIEQVEAVLPRDKRVRLRR